MKPSHLRKIVLTVFLCLAAGAFLAGCTVHYDREDIEEYLVEQYGLTDFRVSDRPRELEGEDGYTDFQWTVTLKENGLQFRVVDNYYWGMESMANYLLDDYEAALLSWLAGEYGLGPELVLEENWWDGALYSTVKAGFSTREELEAQFDRLVEFGQFVSSMGYGEEYDLPFCLEMEFPLRSVTEGEGEYSYPVDDGDTQGSVTELYPYVLDDAVANMAYCSLEYQLDGLEQFTQEELDRVISASGYRLGIYDPDSEMPRLYTDLIANRYAYGVSFGTLYQVLSREGVPVEGDSWHYTFTGADGAEYEISYDFHDQNPAEPDKPQYYYYLRNGEVVWMGAYFYNHFSALEVENLTGLRVYIGPAEIESQ